MEFYTGFEIELLEKVMDLSGVFEITFLECTVKNTQIISNSYKNGVGLLKCHLTFNVEYIPIGLNEIRYIQFCKTYINRINLENNRVFVKEIIISCLDGKIYTENEISITGDVVVIIQEEGS